MLLEPEEGEPHLRPDKLVQLSRRGGTTTDSSVKLSSPNLEKGNTCFSISFRRGKEVKGNTLF
jgi:hypothetical protein